MSEAPIVTVITPFYNAKRWLIEVVAVTQAQTLLNFEHLLVDDSSTDGGAEDLRTIIETDPRYRILTLATNGGPSAARNLALSNARGRYIAFLDADDTWLPEKLNQQVQWMKQAGHAFSFHDYRFMSHDGKLVGDVVNGPDLLTLRTLHTRRGVGCLSVIIDSWQVKNFRFAELHQKAMHEDFVAWLSIIKDGHQGHRLPLDLGRYRITKKSRSSNKLKAAKGLWQVLRIIENLTMTKAVAYFFCYSWGACILHFQARPRHLIKGNK
jgi:teichuronic acid biosynthesis glycosyltransferase TuaG